MDLATGAIGSIISKLADLLKAEYKLQSSVKEQVESLTKELKSAKAFLQDLDKVPPDQLAEQLKLYASEVREASYDMEDVLDTFLVSVQALEPIDEKKKEQLIKRLRKKMTSFFSKTAARHGIAKAIDDIMKRLQKVTERRGRYTVDSIVTRPSPSSVVDPRLAAMYKQVTQLIGIDKSRDELASLLSIQVNSTSDKRLKIVSVVGVGGLGKTTLVKALYENLKAQFSCWAFVPVGRNPDLKKVFRDILIELDKDKHMDPKFTTLDERQLINELRVFLERKRYFIVVDDVWDVKSWETINMALVQNNNGSRIIITTRNSNVAMGEVYKLQPLSDDNSKELLWTRIFGGEDRCHDNQQQKVSDAAQKILRKCGGVPLAIITMASLLVGKSTQEWFDVCNSIGFHDNDKEKLDDTMWILSLSYYDLPSHLKTCLLYLSVFPEDYLIKKDVLIWMWIAKGFVNGRQGIGLFETGEKYFNDLVNRSLIQPVEEEESIVIKGCRVHDMILDLIRSLSRDSNFAIISDNVEETVFGGSARRLALQNGVAHITLHDNQTHKARARSFVAIKCTFGSSVPFQRFKLLRVINLEGCNFIQFDEHIQDLVHLRCLMIRNVDYVKFPREIGALKFVQVLYFDNIRIPLILPSSVGMLTQLVCLRALRTDLPGGIIKKLTSLQELHIVPWVNDNSIGQFVEALGNLRELRELKISIQWMNERTQSDFWKSLCNLHKMQRLELLLGFAWYNQGLPPCIDPSHLPNLSHLSLTLIRVDDQCLKILGGLPELCYLQLFTWGGRATIAATATDTQGYFLKLRSCLLPDSMIQFVVNDEDDSNVSFTIWHRSDDAPEFAPKMMQDSCRAAARAVLPKLEALHFRVNVRELTACENGSHDNMGLEHLASLQKVRVDLDCWDALVDVVEEEEAALRHAIQIHPNRPTLEIRLYVEEEEKRRFYLRAMGDDGVTQSRRSAHEDAEATTTSEHHSS